MDATGGDTKHIWVWREEAMSLDRVLKEELEYFNEQFGNETKAIKMCHSTFILPEDFTTNPNDNKNNTDNTNLLFPKNSQITTKINKLSNFNTNQLQNGYQPFTADLLLLQLKQNKGKSIKEQVTIHHIQEIALQYISDKHLPKMSYGSVIKFDTCLHLIDKLLLCSIKFLDSHLKFASQLTDDNAYNYFDRSSKNLENKLAFLSSEMVTMRQTIAQIYSTLILCLDLHISLHHSHHGRLKTSKSKTDTEFYEALYEYLLYGLWLTFSRNHWDEIKSCIGTLFKSPFTTCLNNQLPPLNAKAINSVQFPKSNKQLALGVLKYKHSKSPVLSSIFPNISDTCTTGTESIVLPQMEALLLMTESIGILGNDLSMYDADTLERQSDSLLISKSALREI